MAAPNKDSSVADTIILDNHAGWKLLKDTARIYNLLPADIPADQFWRFWRAYQDCDTDEDKRGLIIFTGRNTIEKWHKIFTEIQLKAKEKIHIKFQ